MNLGWVVGPVLVLVMTSLVVTSRSSAVKQPNIVLMLADDLGWGDVPWHDAPTIAPTLLSLFGAGIQLDQYYVQPICTPTRGALMTGKYPSRIGLQHMVLGPDEPWGLPLTEKTLANHMQDLGYSVHGIGKWHLGHCSWSHTPLSRGFDSFYGYFNGATDYYTKKLGSFESGQGFDFRYDTKDSKGDIKDDVLWETNTTYSSYLYSKQAQKVISEHDKAQPLLLYMPLQNPHFPAEVPSEYYNMYEGIVKDETRRTLLSMVTALDDNVKTVVDSLKASDLWDNTIFVFFADNGGMLGQFSIGQINYPLRGGKATYWEGGIRSASFVFSPMLKGGFKNTELLHVTDWLPTLTHIGACGVEPDPKCSGPSLGDIDGVNQWSAIIGASPSNRTEFLVNYDQDDKNAALRAGKWKLFEGFPGRGPWVPPPGAASNMSRGGDVITGKQEVVVHFSGRYQETDRHPHRHSNKLVQLYDVIADPYEKEEVSAKHPEVVSQLLVKLQKHKNKAIPPGNKPSDPKANPKNFGGVWTPWLETC